MARKWTVDFRPINCSGWLRGPGGNLHRFTCYPDGTINFERTESIPEGIKARLRSHCHASKWRSSIEVDDLRGCGCGRRR